MGLGVSLGPLDSSVNITFSALTAAFHIPLPAIQWVVVSYVLTYGSLLLGCGRLGDMVGHRRVCLMGLGWSTISLTLCGLAPTFGWFLLCRALQGIGTALVLSCAPALVTLAFPEAQRSKALGLYTMLSAIGYACGPMVGGWLVAHWGWPAVFFFRVPLAVLSGGLMLLYVRPGRVDDLGQRLDIPGALSLMLGLAGALLLLNRLQHLGPWSWPVLLLLGLASGCGGFFIWHERRCTTPVIDLRLFRYPAFAMANIANILANVAGFSILLLVPFFLLHYQHRPPMIGGLLLAMGPLGSVLASPVGGWLLPYMVAYRLSCAGVLLMGLGLAGISQWYADSSAPAIAGALLVQGFGLGLFQVANMDYVMGTLPRFQQGVAGSLALLTRTLGVVGCATLGAMAFGLFQALFTSQLQSPELSPEHRQAQAFLLAFQWVFRGAVLVAGTTGLLLWSTRFVAPGTSAVTVSER